MKNHISLSDLRFNFPHLVKKRGYDKRETVIHSDGTVTSELDSMLTMF
jgi:hypothetical protein